MATLEIVISRPRVGLTYLWSRPTITLNGKRSRARWGVTSFELAPGEFDIAIAVPSLLRSQRGRNDVFVRLLEGDFKRIRYTAPLYSWIPGRIVVDGTLPPARLLRDQGAK